MQRWMPHQRPAVSSEILSRPGGKEEHKAIATGTIEGKEFIDLLQRLMRGVTDQGLEQRGAIRQSSGQATVSEIDRIELPHLAAVHARRGSALLRPVEEKTAQIGIRGGRRREPAGLQDCLGHSFPSLRPIDGYAGNGATESTRGLLFSPAVKGLAQVTSWS